PLTLLGIFAAVFYLLAVGAFLTPRTWNLDPLFMLSLCPMYVIRMNVDPPPAAIFFVLAPMNAATYGALGAAAGFILGAVRKPR
ncbi:MAG TPA: hypothetical protein VND65_02750, partial [Candidatus Binatia bacterium]|nr:hypothetical protein [Candidatus Binatia bacterium]